MDADGSGRVWVAELPCAGGHGDYAAVGVWGRGGVGADVEGCAEVDDEQCRWCWWQGESGVGWCAGQVVEVVDESVQWWSRHFGHVFHGLSIADVWLVGGHSPCPGVPDEDGAVGDLAQPGCAAGVSGDFGGGCVTGAS